MREALQVHTTLCTLLEAQVVSNSKTLECDQDVVLLQQNMTTTPGSELNQYPDIGNESVVLHRELNRLIIAWHICLSRPLAAAHPSPL